MRPDPDRWERVQEICHAALSRAPVDRAAFIRTACGSDAAMRQEIEELLAHEQQAAGFLSEPIAAVAARAIDGSSSAPLAGRRIGAYEVLSLLGAGGMGEVYRARDTELGREVAIKVLPAVFTSDPERLARFEREARVLAALNHPHIGAIYGVERIDGLRALVLELVEGETLAERIGVGRSRLEIRHALEIAQQIAEALEAAHDKGIVHRDLKPSNIKITPGGMVKVLDFGLAKAADGAMRAFSQSPTAIVGGTRDGVLLGTPAYMSPEQARGQPIDKQADIWAFGCVLYEMLTGRMAFAGATASDHIAAILEREPDWTALPSATPPAVHRLLRRCLEKRPNARLHDVADARLELVDALNLPDDDSRLRPESTRTSDRWRTAAIGAGLAAAALLGILVVRNSRP